MSLRLVTIFFDFRNIYAGVDLIEFLQLKLKEYLKNNRQFLRYMTKNALYNRSPLNFLR
ncbi:hypothetical protein DFAR_2550010 [Desulfarculales bacterium]